MRTDCSSPLFDIINFRSKHNLILKTQSQGNINKPNKDRPNRVHTDVCRVKADYNSGHLGFGQERHKLFLHTGWLTIIVTLFEDVISNANSKVQPRPPANMGILYSQEVRKKISISCKTVDMGKWNLGRKHGEETRKRMSEVQLRRLARVKE